MGGGGGGGGGVGWEGVGRCAIFIQFTLIFIFYS